LPSDKTEDDLIHEIDLCKLDFEASMSDDLNTPRAVAAFFKLISLAEKQVKQNQLSSKSMKLILEQISNIDSVFGVLYNVPVFNNELIIDKHESAINTCQCDSAGNGQSIQDLLIKVEELANQRKILKENKKYKEADMIRDTVAAMGYGIKDTNQGFDIFLL
jgi:cysteinyl-tRNA synthetase